MVAQVHRQQEEEEEEEEKGEEVLEQGEEGDKSTRLQLSTSQAVPMTQAGTAQSVTTPAQTSTSQTVVMTQGSTPIRWSSRKVTLTQTYTPGTALTTPTGSQGPPSAPHGASAKHSLQGKGRKSKIVDPDLTPPKLDMTKWTVGGDGDNPDQCAPDPDVRGQYPFHGPIVIVEIEGDKKTGTRVVMHPKPCTSLPVRWLSTQLVSVGVSCGYTDYYQGRGHSIRPTATVINIHEHLI